MSTHRTLSAAEDNGTRLRTAFAGSPRPLDVHSDASTSPSRSTSFGGEDLKKHWIRRIDTAEVLQTLRAKPITVADGVVNAATARIRLILEQLALSEKQIRDADQAIDNLLATL